MNLQARFEKSLKDKYLFHLHTNFADGKSSVFDYCDFALQNGYNQVFFTEHVRKKLLYDFKNFLQEIKSAREKFPKLSIWSGVETKILADGDLDMDMSLLSDVQIVCFAFHSSFKDFDLYEKTVTKAFSDPRWENYIRVWVHPSSFLKSQEKEEKKDFFVDLLNIAVTNNVFIEYNLQYDFFFEDLIKKVAREKLVIGLNAHSVRDCSKLEDIEIHSQNTF